MRFSVLGSLDVVHREERLELLGPKPRAMLGLLLLHPAKVLPLRRMVTAFWGDDAPASSRKMLQNAAWGLRDFLKAGDGDDLPASLVTKEPGYLLRVDPSEVDLTRFRDGCTRGRAAAADGRWETARTELTGALRWWRGPVLDDLGAGQRDWPEVVAIERSRLDALEDLFGAELACGRYREVLPALESAVEQHPSREQLLAQLMIAMYGAGRQLDALAVFRRARTLLLDRYGVEPSQELRGLERAILNQDPALSRRYGLEPAAAPEPVTLSTPVPEPGPEARPAAAEPPQVVVAIQIGGSGATLSRPGPLLEAIAVLRDLLDRVAAEAGDRLIGEQGRTGAA